MSPIKLEIQTLLASVPRLLSGELRMILSSKSNIAHFVGVIKSDLQACSCEVEYLS